MAARGGSFIYNGAGWSRVAEFGEVVALSFLLVEISEERLRRVEVGLLAQQGYRFRHQQLVFGGVVVRQRGTRRMG